MFQRIAAGMITGLLIITPLTVAAEDTPAVSPAPTTTSAPAAPVELSSELNLFLETYFVQLKNKAYDKAYAALGDGFKSMTNLADFTKLADATRLTDFSGKTWTEKKWDAASGLITLKGTFTAGTESHIVTIQMRKKGDTYEILGVTESLSLPLLSSLFPKDAALQALLTKDLSNVAKAIKSGAFHKVYTGMAKSARATLSYSKFGKALRAFKKEKKDIALPSGVQISIDADFPKIKPDGSVLVSGSYKNDKFTVNFTLIYGYEWEWRLTGLNVSPVAL